MTFDPAVHAALITVAIYLIDLLFKKIGVSFGNEVLQALAEVLIGYVLSLFGYDLYARVRAKFLKVNFTDQSYHPPFS